MPALALDIGSYSIKAVVGSPGKQPKVEKTVELQNPISSPVPDDDAQVEKLSTALNNLFADHNLPRRDIRLSLPESRVSTKIIEIPSLNDAELASAIGWQAEQHIPIPLEELALEYEVLYRPSHKEHDKKMRVLMIGVRKELINTYLDVFINIGVEPTILETASLSVFRSLDFSAADMTSLVAHIGATSTDLFIVHEGEIRFVFSHMIGGELLTKTLSRDLGLELQQAEQYKRSYGLNETQFQGKIRAALLPSVDVIANEMLKAVQFFHNQHPQVQVQRVLLSGGSAMLPGLLEYCTQKLGMEALLAAPFATAKGQLPEANHTGFTVAMGLLMREGG